MVNERKKVWQDVKKELKYIQEWLDFIALYHNGIKESRKSTASVLTINQIGEQGTMGSHFVREEFTCKCGCGFDTVDFETLRVCNEAREFEGLPVIVTSGCRCIRHNYLVGGVEDSQHIKARAADLLVQNPEKTYQYLHGKYPNKYGFGLYDGFIHVDTRTNGPARWDSRKTCG